MGLAVNDVVHIMFKGTMFNQTVLTNLAYRVSASTSTNTIAVDQTQIASALADAGEPLNQFFRACMTSDYVLDEISVQRILPVRMTISQFSTGGQPGTRAGVCDTANVAAVVTRKTAFAGRKQRSSLHIAGIANQDITAGVLVPLLVTDLQTFATETTQTKTIAVGGGQTVTLVPVIVHRPLAPGYYDDIVAAEVNTLCRTMRRRTVGLGI